MVATTPKPKPYTPCATLKKIRLEKNLTQDDILSLIAQMGEKPFSSNFISTFETGTRRPWGRAIVLISQALNMKESEVFPEYVKPK